MFSMQRCIFTLLFIHCGNHYYIFILIYIYYTVLVSNMHQINRVTFTSLSAGVSKKRRKKREKSSWKEHSNQRWGERTCVTEMESDERITLLSKVRVMREEKDYLPHIFSFMFRRGPNTMTDTAKPDGDIYVCHKSCEKLLYVSFTCGFRITKSTHNAIK